MVLVYCILARRFLFHFFSLLLLIYLDAELLHHAANDLVSHVLSKFIWYLHLLFLLLVCQLPTNDGILSKSFQHSIQTLLVLPQNPHNFLASKPKQPMNSRNSHSLLQHASESKGNSFGKLFPESCYLKTISKINMNNFSWFPIEHDIGGMPIPQPKNIPDNTHGGETACIIIPFLDPGLAVGRFDP